MAEIIPAIVKHRMKSEADFTAQNPVLLRGELAIIESGVNAGRFKVGVSDTSTYNSLPFYPSRAGAGMLGLIASSSESLKGYVDALGVLTINGLSTALDGKQPNLNRTVRTNLASTSAITDTGGNITPGVTGTLPIANGGTALTAAPSMLTNLASTTAASPLAASPRPGVTGTLPVANGGTGVATLAAGALYQSSDGTSAVESGTLPINMGGTGATTAAAALTNLGGVATEPTASSTDAQVTSAKRLWTMMGAAISTLKTTVKTIVGAINETADSTIASGATSADANTGDIGATLTLTRKDGSTFDIDFTNIIDKLVNKTGANANGNTVFDNADGDDGLAISDTQPATETIAAFETNHEAGNPVRIGHYLKHISNPTDNYRLIGMIDANSAKKLYLLKNKAAAPSDPEQIDPNDEVLNKGEITTAIFGALASIGGALPVPSAIELESELPDISEGAETTLYYLIENMDVSSPDAVRQGQAWAVPRSVEWTKFIDIVNRLSLDAFKQLEDGSWVLADDIQTLIDGAVQGSQIETEEPTEDSADTQITSAKRLWAMLGAALSTLTTTAKTIVGAINELASGKQPNLNRTVRTNLASTTEITDTGGNITPGVTGTLPVANGGTGVATLAEGALYQSAAGTSAVESGTLPINMGGTGATTAAAALAALGGGPPIKARYWHRVRAYITYANSNTPFLVKVDLFLTTKTAIATLANLTTALYTMGATGTTNCITASGMMWNTAGSSSATAWKLAVGVSGSSAGSTFRILYADPLSSSGTSYIDIDTTLTGVTTDVVIDLCA